VNQGTGNVFFTDETPGDLEMLNPATNVVSVWLLGGTPHYTSEDTSGNVFATVAGPSVLSMGDAIYKLDPVMNKLTAWPLPSGLGNFTTGASISSTPDGIEVNNPANSVWFDETAGNKYGRLDLTTNTVFEITKAAIKTPQQIASSGSGTSEQAFATESEGNATDVITPGSGVSVTSKTMTMMPVTRVVTPLDKTETYDEAIITPATTPLTGVDPAGIVHFSPMPAPAGGNPAFSNDPSGMTGVVPPPKGSIGGTIFGSYLAEPAGVSSNSATFEFNSTVILPPPPSDAAITATGVTFSATEGKPFAAQTVANFHDPDPMSTAAEYSATIDWGDGSSSPPPPVTITPTGTSSSGNDFAVKGDHTYTEEGTYTVKVTITDTDTPTNTAMAISTAKVADAALASSCAAAPVSTQSFSGPTATFTDANPFATKADFGATINWGDGTTTAGTISGGPGPGPYTVSGSHTYSTTGTFTITTTISDDGGATTTATCSVIVFAFPTATGAFVIGDLADPLPIVGDSVTWWSSQWAQLNPMSGGPAPASMKGFAGFEDNPLGTPRTCGSSWTTDTGNATPPPASVPEFMGVLVSSTITQSGSVITGNIKQVVVVHNNPGYAPDPGHTGSGTIVAIVCFTP
jgi:hypothetical protein